jgi:hypothetical protein
MIPLLRPRRKPNWELQVAGMVCRACAQAVEAALRRVSGWSSYGPIAAPDGCSSGVRRLSWMPFEKPRRRSATR